MGNGTRLYEKTQTGSVSPEWLASEQYRFVQGGITLDSTQWAADGNGDKLVASGTLIMKSAGGKWEPIGADAVAIAGAYCAVLWQSVNLRDGDVAVGAIDEGRVIGARLPAAPNADQAAALSHVTFI